MILGHCGGIHTTKLKWLVIDHYIGLSCSVFFYCQSSDFYFISFYYFLHACLLTLCSFYLFFLFLFFCSYRCFCIALFSVGFNALMVSFLVYIVTKQCWGKKKKKRASLIEMYSFYEF